MNRPHLSDDEMIGLLYGLGDTADHVAGCAECGNRFDAMRKARAEIVHTREISGRALAIQRQRILERLERPSPGSWRWVSATAAAALLAAGLLLYRPYGISPPVAVNTEADAELFTDVYSMERDVEPRAAAPIRALFQETSFEPAAAGEEPKNQ